MGRPRWWWWRTRVDGRLEELLLESIQSLLEVDDIQGSVLGCERVFDLLRDPRMIEEPPVGRERRIVTSGYFAAGADLFLQLHYRQEEVGVQPERCVDRIEQSELLWGVVAIVGNRSADDGVVLLFDKAVVVFLVRSAPGEGDPFFVAVACQLCVDELRAIVGVKTKEGEG